MEKKERWVPWVPLKKLDRRFDIIALYDRPPNLTLVLNNLQEASHNIYITFNKGVEFYRWADESNRLKSLYEQSEENRSSSPTPCSLFKVINSSYIESLKSHLSSNDQYKKEFLTHFLFIDQNSLIDVISSYEPLIYITEEDHSRRKDG